jgi:hypothetical protein
MINNGSEAVRQRTERSKGRWWNHYLSGARSCSNSAADPAELPARVEGESVDVRGNATAATHKQHLTYFARQAVTTNGAVGVRTTDALVENTAYPADKPARME